MSDHPSIGVRPRWHRVVVGATIGVAVLSGLGLVVLALTVGRCDAFGGRCPGERPPLLDDDVFGTAALGAALIVGVPTLVWHRSGHRFLVVLGTTATTALVVGLMARSSAYG